MLHYKYYKFPSPGDIPNIDEWPEGVDVDVIGQIVDTPGTYDEEGNQLTPPVLLDGWHINVAYQGDKDLSAFESYEIQVNSPVRKWLGQA